MNIQTRDDAKKYKISGATRCSYRVAVRTCHVCTRVEMMEHVLHRVYQKMPQLIGMLNILDEKD
jgi:hypothetical protein